MSGYGECCALERSSAVPSGRGVGRSACKRIQRHIRGWAQTPSPGKRGKESTVASTIVAEARLLQYAVGTGGIGRRTSWAQRFGECGRGGSRGSISRRRGARKRGGPLVR